MSKRILVIAAIALICTTVAAAQQDKSQRPSPPAQAQCKLADGKTITVDYSSPRLKGRQVGGEVAPYGQIWRTGANEATTFVTTADLRAKGTQIPAGNYTIFTLPAKRNWTLIINKHTGEWGIPYTYESEELARVPMKVSKTSGLVENFTIGFDQARKSCTMKLSWGNALASLKFAEK